MSRTVTIGKKCEGCDKDSWRISNSCLETKLVCAVCNPPRMGRRIFPKRVIARRVHSTKPDQGKFSVTDIHVIKPGMRATIEKHAWGYKIIMDRSDA